MKSDPIEFGLAVGARTRHGRRGSSPRTELAVDDPAERTVVAPNLLDEVFALLASDETLIGQSDVAPAGNDLQSAACEALSGRGASDADSLSFSQLSTPKQRIQRQRKLVDNLSAQLAALDRQREHLAGLLQDIDTGQLLDRVDT